MSSLSEIVRGRVPRVSHLIAPMLGSVSSSRHPKIFALAPERFGPIKTETYCIICTFGLQYKICLLNGNSNIRLRLHNSAPRPWLEPTVFGNE